MTQPISCAYSVTGSGPPLILVHGIGASRATWATGRAIRLPRPSDPSSALARPCWLDLASTGSI